MSRHRRINSFALQRNLMRRQLSEAERRRAAGPDGIQRAKAAMPDRSPGRAGSTKGAKINER